MKSTKKNQGHIWVNMLDDFVIWIWQGRHPQTKTAFLSLGHIINFKGSVSGMKMIIGKIWLLNA